MIFCVWFREFHKPKNRNGMEETGKRCQKKCHRLAMASSNVHLFGRVFLFVQLFLHLASILYWPWSMWRIHFRCFLFHAHAHCGEESNVEKSQWQSTNDGMRMNETEENTRRRRIGNWWVHCFVTRKITRFVIKTTARHGPRVLSTFLLVLSMAHSWMSCFVNEIVRCTGMT